MNACGMGKENSGERQGGKIYAPDARIQGGLRGIYRGIRAVFPATIPLFLAEKITEALFFKGKLQKVVDFLAGI